MTYFLGGALALAAGASVYAGSRETKDEFDALERRYSWSDARCRRLGVPELAGRIGIIAAFVFGVLGSIAQFCAHGKAALALFGGATLGGAILAATPFVIGTYMARTASTHLRTVSEGAI